MIWLCPAADDEWLTPFSTGPDASSLSARRLCPGIYTHMASRDVGCMMPHPLPPRGATTGYFIQTSSHRWHHVLWYLKCLWAYASAMGLCSDVMHPFPPSLRSPELFLRIRGLRGHGRSAPVMPISIESTPATPLAHVPRIRLLRKGPRTRRVGDVSPDRVGF